MGRKSTAEVILSQFEGQPPGEEGRYLVVYDFEGESIHHRFFENLQRIMNCLEDGERLQYSVIECRHLKTAQAVKALAVHYGCSNIHIYKVLGIKE